MFFTVFIFLFYLIVFLVFGYCDDYVILVFYVLIILIGFLIILIVTIKFFHHYTVPILTTKAYVAHVWLIWYWVFSQDVLGWA